VGIKININDVEILQVFPADKKINLQDIISLRI